MAKSKKPQCPCISGTELDNEEIGSLHMHIKGDNIEFNYDAYSCDSSFEDKLKINFCPFCGKKLN